MRRFRNPAAGSRFLLTSRKILIHYEIAKTISSLEVEKSNINQGRGSSAGSAGHPHGEALL